MKCERWRQALLKQDIGRVAGSFPSLRRAPGLDPWEAVALDAWAGGLREDDPALHAARFLLEVWDPSVAWRCGAFELVGAMCCWDFFHRAAYLNGVYELRIPGELDRLRRAGRR